MKISKNSLLILLLTIFLGACVEQVPYSNYQFIKGAKWTPTDTITFDFDSLEVDPALRYDAQLSVIHSRRYPYQNLSLVVAHNLQDTVMVTDTLHLTLGNEHGKWLGAGTAGLIQYDIDWLPHLQMDSTRSYRVEVRHMMRDNPLRGVERIGVTIDKSGQKKGYSLWK